MNGVSGICESIHPSDGIGGCALCYVCLCGAHESSPVLDGVRMSQDHCLDGMDTHKLHKTVKKELPCSHNDKDINIETSDLTSVFCIEFMCFIWSDISHSLSDYKEVALFYHCHNCLIEQKE